MNIVRAVCVNKECCSDRLHESCEQLLTRDYKIKPTSSDQSLAFATQFLSELDEMNSLKLLCYINKHCIVYILNVFLFKFKQSIA